MKRKYKRVASSLRDILMRPDMSILPGQLAFFFILSLVPTMTIIFYFASFLNISVTDITSLFNVTISSSLLELITPYIEDTTFSLSLVILLIVGIYLASNGTNSMIVTANSIYGLENKSFLERRIKAIIMVFVLILLFLFILVVPIFGSFLLKLLGQASDNYVIYSALNVLKVPFSWFVIFFFIKILYTIAPDKQIPSAYVNTGALFTSVGWMIATELYLYYVGHFAHYNIYYSGLSNIAVLMIWFYILATIFVIGMGLNYREEPYEIERTQKLEEIKAAKKTQNKIKEK